MRGPAAAALVAAVALCLRRRLLVATVVGTSMLPAYRPGERVLVRRRAPGLRVGDVVVVVSPDEAGDPDPRLLVKRVAALAGDPLADGAVVPRGTVVVLGDNGGYDSREFGPLPHAQVVGVVLRRLGGRDGRRPGAGESGVLCVRGREGGG